MTDGFCFFPRTSARTDTGSATSSTSSGSPTATRLSPTTSGHLETVPLASFAPALGGAAPVRYSDDVTLLTLGSVRPLPAHALHRLAGHAIGLQAMRMSEESTETSGVIGLSTFAEEVRSWESRADWKRCLRLAGQAIELRGCGGGFFRRLYAEFLEEAVRLGEASAAPLVPLALASADAFTQLARELERAYQLETPRLAEAQERARRCVEAERALWAEATREPTPS